LSLRAVIWLPGSAGGGIADAHTGFYGRFAGDSHNTDG
jgi:hypothetical protein